MLGVAIRIAQRMGIHSESALAKCTTGEAEMRRRLWWSIVLFDTRVGEMANSKAGTLDPTWDCKIPLNVNDSDLRLEMKETPAIQGTSTEALFVVVRCELGEFIRHSVFHLDFTNPALKPVAKQQHNGSAPEDNELVKLEHMIEHQYLKSCNQENPIHFMTIWTTQAYLARCRLLEHHSRYFSPSLRQTEAQHDAATSYAIRMLKCDTKIMTSSLTKGFLWLNHLHFPLPAYIQIVQDLKRRPTSEQTQQAWDAMSDNYEAWLGSYPREDNPFLQIFAKTVIQAWEACEAAFKQLGKNLTSPRIVLSMKYTIAQIGQYARYADTEQLNTMMSMGSDDFQLPMSIDLSYFQNLPYDMGMQDGYTVMRPETYSDMSEHAPSHAQMNQLNWAALDGRPDWEGR